MRLFRFIKIIAVARRYGVDTLILEQEPGGWLGRAARFFRVFGARAAPFPRGERIRRMLEDLGPIFVKFGPTIILLSVIFIFLYYKPNYFFKQ